MQSNKYDLRSSNANFIWGANHWLSFSLALMLDVSNHSNIRIWINLYIKKTQRLNITSLFSHVSTGSKIRVLYFYISPGHHVFFGQNTVRSWPQRTGIVRQLQQWQQTTGQSPWHSSRFPRFFQKLWRKGPKKDWEGKRFLETMLLQRQFLCCDILQFYLNIKKYYIKINVALTKLIIYAQCTQAKKKLQGLKAT